MSRGARAEMSRGAAAATSQGRLAEPAPPRVRATAEQPDRVLPRLAAAMGAFRLPPSLAYLLRVSLAVVITYWLAFFMQLPTPYSAVTTVFIVANPLRGAIVSKSAWRLGGTVVGAAAAVLQFALFGQAPLLFDLYMAVWVGLCCAGSTLLRFFASYGTVLAGYTVVIVDVGGFGDPGNALLIALDRISVVAIGIVVTGLVFLLTQSPPEPAKLEAEVAARAVALARLVRSVMDGEDLATARDRRRDLSLGLGALEQSIVLGGADSLEIRRRDLALRYALTRLSGALTSGMHAGQSLGGVSEAARLFGDGLDGFIAAAERDRLAARRALDAARAALGGLLDPAVPLDDLAAIDQARETLDRLGRVLDDLEISRTGRPDDRAPLGRYRDVRSAARNGVRGFLTVAIAASFWYATEWPSGPTMLAYLVPAVALLSNTPSPSAAALMFVRGTLVSVVMATLFQAVLLPPIAGFPLAVGLLLLFVAPGIVGQLSPRYGQLAFAYLVFFNTQVSLQNPMRYDLPALVNSDEAYGLGCAGLLVVFRLLIPLNNNLVSAYLAASVANAVRRLARRPEGDAIGWENIQLQKLVQMSDRLAAQGSPRRAELVEDAAAGLMVGRLIRRMRRLTEAPGADPSLRAAIGRAIGQIAGGVHRPFATADAIGGEAAGLAAGARSTSDLEAASMMHEAARLMRRHADFFARRLVVA